MPCSGLNRATSLTPSALNRTSIVGAPSAVAAGVVGDEPDLAALEPGELLAGQDVDAGLDGGSRLC